MTQATKTVEVWYYGDYDKTRLRRRNLVTTRRSSERVLKARRDKAYAAGREFFNFLVNNTTGLFYDGVIDAYRDYEKEHGNDGSWQSMKSVFEKRGD